MYSARRRLPAALALALAAHGCSHKDRAAPGDAAADLETGPYERAGAWFADRPAAADQLRAARAFDRASMAERATLACDRAIATEKHTPKEEEEARALRLRLGTDPGKRKADAR